MALGVTAWSPSAPLVDVPVLAAQLWQKPASARDQPAAKDSRDSKSSKEPRASKEPKESKESKKAAAATKKHAPPASPGPRRAALSKSTDTLEAEVFGEPPPAVRRKPARHRAHVVRRDVGDGDGDEAADDSADESEDEEEEEDDDGAWAESLPVIAPRLFSLGVGTAFIGRSFRFDAPLQPESTFPRAGVAVDLETFPLSRLRGWLSGLGLGGSFATELGSAGINQADGGRLSYPITERRWDASLRYAIALGGHFVAVPMVGFGQSAYEVQRKSELAPSACGSTATQVCLPDVHLSHLSFGAAARIAFNSSVGVALGAAYLLGFGLGKQTGELGSEATSSAARGVSAELALVWQVKDWLAVRVASPFVRYAYAFGGAGLPYRSATETYYGGILSATIFTR
jgi:hypothetical protein